MVVESDSECEYLSEGNKSQVVNIVKTVGWQDSWCWDSSEQ